MRSFFDRWYDEVALRHVQQGRGTGPWSKIVSAATFPLLAAFAVMLIKAAQYIPLGALAVALVFSKLWLLVSLGCLVFFAVTQYWTGVSVLAGYFMLSYASMLLGRKHVKDLLLRGKPIVGPFEGAQDMVVYIALECIFIALATATRGLLSMIFWLVFGLVCLYHFGRCWYRLYPRWQRVHGPLMFRYAGAAGIEAGLAEREQRSFDLRSATMELLRSVYSEKEDAELEELLDSIENRMLRYSDRELIEAEIRRLNPAVTQDELTDASNCICALVQSSDEKALLTRYAIAEVVHDVYGPEERGRYLLAVLRGQAR